MDSAAVLHVGARAHTDDIADADAQIAAHDLVHQNLLVGDVVVGEDNADLGKL